MKNDFIEINTRRLLNRIRKIQNFFIARKYKNSLQKPIHCQDDYEWNIIDKGITKENFIYRDESWSEVKNMGGIGVAEWLGYSKIMIPEGIPKTNRVDFGGSGVSICSEEIKEHRWIILKYYKPLGSVYAVEFTAKIESVFTELQFAFNWESITTRDRFQIINNRMLIFQNVFKGSFLPHLAEKSFSIELGKPTHFQVVIMENTYSITINKQLEMSFTLPFKPLINNGEFAFIFFEKAATHKILAELNDVSISVGVKKNK